MESESKGSSGGSGSELITRDWRLIKDCCIRYMKTVEDGRFQLTLTDIPYEVVNRDSNGLRNFDKTAADVRTFDLNLFLEEVIRVTSGSIYIFCSTEQVSQIRSVLVDRGLTTRLGIWEKSNPSPVNGQYVWLSGVECCVYGKKPKAPFHAHCKNTVWRYPVERGKWHPTQKPLSLFQYLVSVSSDEGATVFDPCAGSGTTLAAAVSQGRKAVGCELNDEFYAKAVGRLEVFPTQNRDTESKLESVPNLRV